MSDRGAVCSVSFELDEAVEPGDVVLGGLGAVLHQGSGVDVEPVPRGACPVGGQPPGQLGPAALEEGQPGLGARWRAKARRRPKLRASSVPAGSSASRSCSKSRRPSLGDPVHLARPLGALCGPGPARARSPARSPLRDPVEGMGAPAAAGRFGDGHRPGRLETGQRRVERSEGDVGEQAQLVAEAAADLVAMELLLVEETRGWPGRASSAPMARSGRMTGFRGLQGARTTGVHQLHSRDDISLRYINAIHTRRSYGVAGSATAGLGRSGGPGRRATVRRHECARRRHKGAVALTVPYLFDGLPWAA